MLFYFFLLQVIREFNIVASIVQVPGEFCLRSLLFRYSRVLRDGCFKLFFGRFLLTAVIVFFVFAILRIRIVEMR